MAGFSAIATGLGIGLQLVGTFMAASAQSRMAEEQKEASITAENSRRQQMQLDASRRRRQAIREMLFARSTALSTGVNQGAGGQSSGVLGAMGQATATGRQNVQTVNAAETLGGRVFDANIQFAEATARGQKGMAMGGAISSLGGALVSLAGTFGRVGTYATSPRYAQ